ncbi:MAG: sugar kinase [Polyangiaceae bacterium]|nr:sugar kinase [Polyangiaceae bacterium]
MTSSRAPVLIVGSMAFDDLELPTGSFRDTVGGSATFASYAASTFTTVRTVAVVGDDFPEDVLKTLASRGVATGAIERASGKTFRWAGRYDADLVGRTTLDTQLNVFADFQPKIPADYAESPIVLLGNIHPELQSNVLDACVAPKLVVADTMNFWIQGEPQKLAKLLSRAQVLIINDEEARELSGIHNIRRAAADIRKRGPHTLIIKRGEHGALLFDDTGIFAVPGYPLENVVDPTGAGDSFAGGFVGYLAAHLDRQSAMGHVLRSAMLYGTATASYCVEGVGTSKIQTLVMGDVEARVTQIRALFELPR